MTLLTATLRWHPPASIADAKTEQLRLAERVIVRDDFAEITTIAGVDMALDPERKLGVAGIIVYRYPALTEVTRVFAAAPLTFPYVPGLLSYREIPVLLATFAKLPTLPDLLVCDGQGIAHPRGIGIASHLGLFLDRPTIGCAKSILVGTHDALPDCVGATAPLRYRERDVGVALRTKLRCHPIYISPGHRISHATALNMVQQCCDGYRIPKPTREADRYVAECKKLV